MKLVCLLVAALCAYAHAAVPQNVVADSVQANWGSHEMHLKVASNEVGNIQDDQLLSTELAELERVQGRNIVADSIRNLLESLRPTVVNGNENIPVLDPLNIGHVGPFEYRSLGVRATGNLYDFQLDGLRWYVVDTVTFNTLRLAIGVQVTIPFFTFTGSYDAHAVITLLSHTAGGNFRVFVNRIETDVHVRLGTNIFGGGHLTLRELDIDIVIHDINVQIEGMVGSSILNNMINSMVQNAAQNLLRDELDNVSQLLSEQLFDVVNDLLRNFTLDDLLGG